MKSKFAKICTASLSVLGILGTFSSCDNGMLSSYDASSAVVKESRSLSISANIEKPFGLVASVPSDNTVALAWGHPFSMPDSWEIYVDGEKVLDVTEFRQTEFFVYSGKHVIGIAAVKNGQRSLAEEISVTVRGEAAPAAGGIVSGGTYKIISSVSSLSLDSDNWGKTNGTNVCQWAYGNNQANQQWKIVSVGDGYFYIENVYSHLVVDVEDVSMKEGANVHMWEYVGGANQVWKFESLDDGTYKIVNKNSGLVLDVSAASVVNGANIQQWTWNGTGAQRWKLEKIDSSVAVPGAPVEAPTETPVETPAETPVETPNNQGYIPNPSVNLPSVISKSTAGEFQKLVPLKNGMQLTYQFENCTNGAWRDDQIFIYVICMNSNNQWCYGTPDGTLIPIGDTRSSAWQYTLAQVKNTGFQMPFASAGRIYYSYGKPLEMWGMRGGVVLPSLSNENDPNYKTYYDWLEYTIAPNGLWVNTTQVDQFCFPVLMNVYDKDGKVLQTGITKSRNDLFRTFKNEMPDEFDTLVNEYRIVAPCKSAFDERTKGAYGSYFDAYVTQVWNKWASEKATVTHPQGKFILSGNGKDLNFECIESYGSLCKVGSVYTIHGKPTTSEVFEGYGTLASGNPMELALEAWICAALNRHVAHMTPDVYWNNAQYYYNDGPCNFYSKFWHDHSERGGLAYGFCYDDVNDQSATTFTTNYRGIVVKLGF